MPTVSPDDPAASGPSSTPGTGPSRYGPPLVRRTIVADALLDPAERQRLGFPAGESEPLPVVIELNLRHHEGLTGATRRFLELYQGLPGERLDPEPELVAETYYRCRLSVEQVRALVAADMVDTDPARTALYRIWPDFPVNPLIDLSCSTVKADAARRSYGAGGRGISWAATSRTCTGISPCRADPSAAPPCGTGSATAPTSPGSSPAGWPPGTSAPAASSSGWWSVSWTPTSRACRASTSGRWTRGHWPAWPPNASWSA